MPLRRSKIFGRGYTGEDRGTLFLRRKVNQTRIEPGLPAGWQPDCYGQFRAPVQAR